MSKILSYKKHIEKRLCLQYLMHLDSPGIVALVNEKHKKVFVIGSKHVMKALGVVISDLANRTHSNKQLVKDSHRLYIKQLELCDPKHVKTLKLKWIAEFKSNGYEIYNTEALPKYQVRTRKIFSGYEICVVSSGKRWYSVRSFQSEAEVEEFMKTTTVYDLLMLL